MRWWVGAECSLCGDVSSNPPINDHPADREPQIELSGRHSNLMHLTVHSNRPVAFVVWFSSCNYFIHQAKETKRGVGFKPLHNWLKEKRLSVLHFLQNEAKPLSTYIIFYCLSAGQKKEKKIVHDLPKGSCECEVAVYFICTDSEAHSLWPFICFMLIKILVGKSTAASAYKRRVCTEKKKKTACFPLLVL